MNIVLFIVIFGIVFNLLYYIFFGVIFKPKYRKFIFQKKYLEKNRMNVNLLKNLSKRIGE